LRTINDTRVLYYGIHLKYNLNLIYSVSFKERLIYSVFFKELLMTLLCPLAVVNILASNVRFNININIFYHVVALIILKKQIFSTFIDKSILIMQVFFFCYCLEGSSYLPF